MTFRKHLRFLYEIFLPREARFPDERFWSGSGEPVAMKRKGPPKGTVGTTSKDLGVKDAADDDFDPPDPTRSGGSDLYDHFSKTFPEFQKAIMDAARKLFGPNFERLIDKSFGKPGLTQEAIKDLWDANATDHEAVGEIGFLFDTAQGSTQGSMGHYRGVTKPGYFRRPKEDWDDSVNDTVPRKSRPLGSKDGKLVF